MYQLKIKINKENRLKNILKYGILFEIECPQKR